MCTTLKCWKRISVLDLAFLRLSTLNENDDAEEASEELNKIYNGIMACVDFIYLIYNVRWCCRISRWCRETDIRIFVYHYSLYSV